MDNEKLSYFTDLEGINKIVERKPVTFIHGDNMAFLRKCKDEMMRGYFHVGIVDPPYGISVGDMKLGATATSKPRNYEMGQWDNEVPTAEYWYLLKYVCRNLIIWGGNYFTNANGNFFIAETVTGEDILCNTVDITPQGLKINNKLYEKGTIKKFVVADGIKTGRCCVAWDKMNNGMSFADFELALTTFDKSARIVKKSRAGQADDGDKRHPTQKPVYLYDWLHLEFVEKRQRVLDTHGGSHTHAIAAYRNDVELTIIEREESYHLAGIKAYENGTTKDRLF